MLKLTPALRRILDRIEKQSPILELLITASGGRAPSQVNALIRAGYATRVDHPTVKAGRYPADALAITEAGRAALKGPRS